MPFLAGVMYWLMVMISIAATTAGLGRLNAAPGSALSLPLPLPLADTVTACTDPATTAAGASSFINASFDRRAAYFRTTTAEQPSSLIPGTLRRGALHYHGGVPAVTIWMTTCLDGIDVRVLVSGTVSVLPRNASVLILTTSSHSRHKTDDGAAVLRVTLGSSAAHGRLSKKSDDALPSFIVHAETPVLVANATSATHLLYFPLLSHKFIDDHHSSSAIMLRAQTSADLDLPCSDAVFVSYTNGSDWSPAGESNCAQGHCEEVQKRTCYPYPLGARDSALCLPYARDVDAPHPSPGAHPHAYPWPPPSPPQAACQQRLDAYCNKASTTNVCPTACKKEGWNASLVALYDRGCPHPPCRTPLSISPAAWRCYSPDALSLGLKHWSNASKHPDAYCSGTSSELGALYTTSLNCKAAPIPRNSSKKHVDYLGTVWQFKDGVLAADPARRDNVPVSFSDPFMQPGSRRFTDGNAIATADGKGMLICLYAMDGRTHAGVSGFSIHCYSSGDGTSFEHRSTVGVVQDANENWMVRLGDRRIMLVFRTNPKPVPDPKTHPEGGLYQTFSSDDGKNWSTPTLMAAGTGPGGVPHRVEPKLFRFPDLGAVVLSTGRIGQYLYYVRESDLKPGHEADARWDSWDVQAHHDAALPDLPQWHFQSCGAGATYYTSITVLDENTMVLSYDRLPEQGSTCPRLDSVFTVKLRLAPSTGARSKSDDESVNISMSNVVERRDIHGFLMDAHDGKVVQWVPGGDYFWYAMEYGNVTEGATGCEQTHKDAAGFRSDHNISIWQSPDLVSWTLVRREAVLIADRPLGIYFRPKVLFNKKTGDYVMWVNWMEYPTPYSAGYYLSLTTRSPSGPFTIINRNISMTQQQPAIFCDFDLLCDDDGKSYIIYTVWRPQGLPKQATHMSVEQLSADHTSSAFKASPVFTGPAANGDEAPVLFRRKGVVYAMFGHGCCFCAAGSGVNVFTAAHPLGPYTKSSYDIGCENAGDNIGNCTSVVRAQQNCVFDVETTSGPQMIWTGDRWMSAPDHKKSHDMQTWVPLSFDDSVNPPRVKRLRWIDDFNLSLKSDDDATPTATSLSSTAAQNTDDEQPNDTPSHLRIFSFYSHACDNLPAQQGIVNVRLGHSNALGGSQGWYKKDKNGKFVSNFTDVISGSTEFGMSSFLDIEGLVWNRSLYPAVSAFLTYDYKAMIRAVVVAAKPLLDSGVVRGFFLGDELACTGTSPANISAVSSYCREQLVAAGNPDADIYINECARAFIGAGEWGGGAWPGWIKGMIPAGLSLISIDNYKLANATNRSGTVTPWWVQEVLDVKRLYSLAFSGRLHPHQQLLVVPGLYGNDSATASEHDLHDSQLVSKMELYADWMRRDSNIVGLCPYHWEDTPNPPRPGSGPWVCFEPNKLPGNCGHVGELFGRGARHYPKLLAKLREIGSWFPPAVPPAPPIPTNHRVFNTDQHKTINLLGGYNARARKADDVGGAPTHISNASLRMLSDQGCAVLDISASTTPLQAAVMQARRKKATSPAKCVHIFLGERSFFLPTPMELSGDDGDTSIIGGELTAGIDVPPAAWGSPAAKVRKCNTALGKTCDDARRASAGNCWVCENVHQHALQVADCSAADLSTFCTGTNSPQAISSDYVELDTSSFVNTATAFGSQDLAKDSAHLQLLVEVRGTWRPMAMARWPNVPFEFDEIPPVNWSSVGALPDPNCGSTCRSFQWCTRENAHHTGCNATERPADWVAAAAAGRLFVHGFFKYLWRDNRVQINTVDVSKQQLITNSTTISPTGVFPSAVWYAYGLSLHEELDVPGEFALNRTDGVLSAILPSGCVQDGVVVCKTRLVPASSAANAAGPFSVVLITDTADITLRGMNITGSAGSGVTVQNSSNITIDRCKVNNVATGVTVGGEHPRKGRAVTKNVSLLHSEVGYTMLASTVWSGGNRSTLQKPGFLCENNRLHDFGRWTYTYSGGAHMTGYGIVVRKNLFFSSYHLALLFSGNDHLIELNEIRNVVTIAYDTGAIYAGRDLSSRGTIIRHNFFHNLSNPAPCNEETSCIRMAVYIDDFEGGCSISGNIFFKVPTGFFSNCGGDFNFSNNLFVETGTTIRQSVSSSFHDVEQYLWTQLHAVPFTSPLWVERYPELARRFGDWKIGTHPDPGMTVSRNNFYTLNAAVNITGPVVFPGEGPLTRFHNWTANANGEFSLPAPWFTPGAANTTQYFDIQSDNILTPDPGFVSADPAADLNFALKPSSPLFGLGWQHIPQEQIGPDDDELVVYRANF